MQIQRYLATRFTTLIPPMTVPENPLKLVRTLNRQQTAFFIVAFLAWTWDSFDFCAVILNVVTIANTYQKSTSDVTWGITVTLMLRPVGAILFGIASDRFGRKWTFIVNVFLYAIIEISTGFCASYTQFIGVRALFGIAMGGIYGNCAATALEDAPITARGLLSGLLQQGFALGYMLAAAFNLAITNNQRYSWRALFWFGGGPPLLVALWRFFLPETQAFLRSKEARAAAAADIADDANQQKSSARRLLATVRSVLVHNWLIFIYLILLMTGFNFLSHGSQDLYPTFLTSQLEFSPSLVTVTTIVANCGAIVGGTLIGYLSSFFGRRLSIVVTLIIGAALIPAYVLPKGMTIMAGAFFQQFCVQGVWGVVPIYLFELSPEQYRSFVIGTSYQLGNLISAASSTIEATASQHFPLHTSSKSSDQNVYDYGKVVAIFLACIYIYLLIIVLLGPERRNIDETEDNNTTNVEIQLETPANAETVSKV